MDRRDAQSKRESTSIDFIVTSAREIENPAEVFEYFLRDSNGQTIYPNTNFRSSFCGLDRAFELLPLQGVSSYIIFSYFTHKSHFLSFESSLVAQNLNASKVPSTGQASALHPRQDRISGCNTRDACIWIIHAWEQKKKRCSLERPGEL